MWIVRQGVIFIWQLRYHPIILERALDILGALGQADASIQDKNVG